MYEIILLDYSMPEMDGPQVATEIRRIFQSSILLNEDKVPYICCCTAYAEALFNDRRWQQAWNTSSQSRSMLSN